MSKILEGHARAIVKSLEFPEGTTPMRIDYVTARAVLLHELSLEPSEACVEAMVTAFQNIGPAVDYLSNLDWQRIVVRTILQSLRDTRRKEIKR